MHVNRGSETADFLDFFLAVTTTTTTLSLDPVTLKAWRGEDEVVRIA